LCNDSALVYQCLKSHPFSIAQYCFDKKQISQKAFGACCSIAVLNNHQDSDLLVRVQTPQQELEKIPVHGLKVPRGGDHVWGGELVEFLLAGALAGHVAGARGRPVPGTKHTLSFT
jgi:hypothetical protein